MCRGGPDLFFVTAAERQADGARRDKGAERSIPAEFKGLE